MEKKLTLKDWIVAMRPWSFTASGLTVLTALFYLHWLTGSVDWKIGLWAVVGIILFHASGNMWSDYFDYVSGVDCVEGAYSSDSSLVRGVFQPKQLRNYALTVLLVASCVGLWLIFRTGWTLFWIGLGGLVCTLGYPYFKYRALGDLTILMAYGFLPAIGTSCVALGTIDWRVLWVALPIGLLVDSILHANNTRDMITDGKASIRTMAHGLGLRASVVLYILEQLVPFCWVVFCVPFGKFPILSLVAIFVMRVALANCTMMRTFKDSGDPKDIASLDQRSAQLQMLFCLVMILSLAVDTWVL